MKVLSWNFKIKNFLLALLKFFYQKITKINIYLQNTNNHLHTILKMISVHDANMLFIDRTDPLNSFIYPLQSSELEIIKLIDLVGQIQRSKNFHLFYMIVSTVQSLPKPIGRLKRLVHSKPFSLKMWWKMSSIWMWYMRARLSKSRLKVWIIYVNWGVSVGSIDRGFYWKAGVLWKKCKRAPANYIQILYSEEDREFHEL